MHLTVCYYQVTYEFESESIPYSLSEYQQTPFSKQAPYVKMKEDQRDSNTQALSTSRKTQAFTQTWQMIELCCEYLPLRYSCLYAIINSRTDFRVNAHRTLCLNVKELFAQGKRHI